MMGFGSSIAKAWQKHGLMLVGLPLACLGWLVLWLLPWQSLLSHHPWFKIAVVLAAVIVPGLCIFGLASDEDGWERAIPYGFSISFLLITMLGLAARMAQLSSSVLQAGFLAVGLIALVPAFMKRGERKPSSISGSFHASRVLAFLPLFLLAALLLLLTTERILSDDDLIYIAYQNYFARASTLGFEEIIFGSGQLTPARFWLTAVPLVQALLADAANVSALVLNAGYYDALLVPVSALACYALARRVGLSRPLASLSVAMQFCALVLISEYLHPGSPFIRQLGTDKATAAFILAPVFLDSILTIMKKASGGNVILGLLSGLSLSAAHPVIFAFTGIIAALMALFGLGRGLPWKRILVPAAVILAGLVPQAAVRFSHHPSLELYRTSETLATAGTESMVKMWGAGLYGLNPALLAMRWPYEARLGLLPPSILHFGWLILLLPVLYFAVRDLRDEPAAQLLLASFALPFLACLPWTGTLLGFFFTPWMLERTLWLFPFGLAGTYLLKKLGDVTLTTWAQPLRNHKVLVQNLTIGITTALCALLVLLYMREQQLPDFERLRRLVIRYEALSEIGAFLDAQNDLNVTVAGNDALNDLIPAVSLKGKLISYRPSDPTYSYFLSESARQSRLRDRQAIFSQASLQDKLEIIRRYQVRYLLLREDESSSINDLLSLRPSLVLQVMRVGSYSLYSVGPQ